MGQTYYLLLINIKIEKRKQFRLTFQNFSRLFFQNGGDAKKLICKKNLFCFIFVWFYEVGVVSAEEPETQLLQIIKFCIFLRNSNLDYFEFSKLGWKFYDIDLG